MHRVLAFPNKKRTLLHSVATSPLLKEGTVGSWNLVSRSRGTANATRGKFKGKEKN